MLQTTQYMFTELLHSTQNILIEMLQTTQTMFIEMLQNTQNMFIEMLQTTQNIYKHTDLKLWYKCILYLYFLLYSSHYFENHVYISKYPGFV